MGMKCYREGGCGPYEGRACNECPASKPEYALNHKLQEEYNEQLEAFFANKDAIKRIINAVNYHALSFDDAAKIIEICAPYCDVKSADGFIMWLKLCLKANFW